MIQVPTLVNGLAGTFVATANGVAIARGGAGAAQGGMKSMTQMATPRIAQLGSAVGAANAAGGGVGTRVGAAMQDAKQTSAAMRENREKIGQRNMERGQRTSFGERNEAGRAAMVQQVRENKNARAGGDSQAAAIKSAMSNAAKKRP